MGKRGLSDGDELVATRTKLLTGDFGERRIGCLTCGSIETVHVTFSDSLPTMEISKQGGRSQSFQYSFGEVRHGSQQSELALDLLEQKGAAMCTDVSTYQGALYISNTDPAKRRLVIPNLDIDVLDANYLEDKRREMQQIRLHMLGCLDVLGLNKFFRSDAFAVLCNSRRWLAEGVMEHMQSS